MTTPAPHHLSLLTLTAEEVQAVIKGALFWYAGEGAMDGDTHHALHDAMKKLVLEQNAAEVQP